MQEVPVKMKGVPQLRFVMYVEREGREGVRACVREAEGRAAHLVL